MDENLQTPTSPSPRSAHRALEGLQATATSPAASRARRRVAARLRDAANRLEGSAYRLLDEGPDPDVGDDVLTQRIRSTIGPLEKRPDVPRLHVTVTDHVAHLRGVVGAVADVATLERAVRAVAGVSEVHSHVHVGLRPGDTRPSQGRSRRAPSLASRELSGAVRSTGMDDDETVDAVTTASLTAFCDVLPSDERAHVLAHLPEDVRQRLAEHVRIGTPERSRTPAELYRLVADAAAIPVGTAGEATRAVLGVLRELVPEEVADVEAVLPTDLKPLWQQPIALR